MPDIVKDLQHLKTLAPKQKILILAVFVALFVLGLVFGIAFTRRATAPLSTPTISILPTVKPTADLSLQPAEATLSVGETLPVSVVLTKEGVQAIDVFLSFDPQYLSIANIEPGSDFPMVIRQDLSVARLAVSVSRKPDNPTPETGEVFSFTLTALSATDSASISFDSEATIAARNGENIVGKMVEGRYKIE